MIEEQQEEGTICSICEKTMGDIEWTWGDEDAHKKCVINKASKMCSKGCTYFSDVYGESCESCNAPMRTMIEEDKKQWRKRI